MILIFSTDLDYSTNEVIKWLNFYGEKVIRINYETKNEFITFISDDKIIYSDLKGNEVNLLDATSYWYRRGGISNSMINFKPEVLASKFIFNGTDNEIILERHLKAQKKSIEEYIFWKIESKISRKIGSFFKADLNRLMVAEIAKSVGLSIPPFFLINNTSKIEELSAVHGQLVSKSVENGIYVTSGNKAYYTYTELIEPETIKKDQNVMLSLVVQKIEKRIEIRTFYFEKKFYSMAIFSQSNAETAVDYRKYSTKKPNRYEPYKLPENIERKLEELFIKLGLDTGSVDLIFDNNEDYIFLEINPVGQFGMVSQPCNYTLEKHIAQYLIG